MVAHRSGFAGGYAQRPRVERNVHTMTTLAGDARSGLRLSTAAGRWVLLATVLGSALAAIDATVVGIALPAIGKDFKAGLTSLQWTVTAYTLTLAGLLLFGGALGDRFGRRRIFVVGVGIFAVASAACGLAPNVGWLIAARLVQGVGSALLTPGSLAIVQASFDPRDRSAAVGAWSGLGGVATALGPLLGGWLVQVASWRLIFYINLPLAIAVVLIAGRHVPETRTPKTGSLDVSGGSLITAGLIGATYGILEGPGEGWTAPGVQASLGAGILCFAAFVIRERRAEDPLLSWGLFRNRNFSATNLVTFIMYGALGGALFLLPVQLQVVLGFSPLKAGVSLLPVTVIMLLLSSRSGALAARIGPRLQMATGPAITGAGLVLMARIGVGGTYASDVLPAVLVLGFGLATTVAPLTATALSSVPADHAGMASAVNNDVARTGGLIAVAVLPPIAGLSGYAYLHPSSLSHGFHVAVTISGGLCALAGLVAVATVRNQPSEQAQAAPPRCCGIEGPPPPAYAGSTTGSSRDQD
jgi:EmrB/QacA subfamily drug resistance transporter